MIKIFLKLSGGSLVKRDQTFVLVHFRDEESQLGVVPISRGMYRMDPLKTTSPIGSMEFFAGERRLTPTTKGISSTSFFLASSRTAPFLGHIQLESLNIVYRFE